MNHSKYLKYTRNGLFSLPLMLASMSAGATDFTAGIVMEKMSPDERVVYLSGVVEGLAYARYAKDGKKTDGMKCIYDWFYESKGTVTKIYSAFERFSDYLPGAVVAAMVEKECGS